MMVGGLPLLILFAHTHKDIMKNSIDEDFYSNHRNQKTKTQRIEKKNKLKFFKKSHTKHQTKDKRM